MTDRDDKYHLTRPFNIGGEKYAPGAEITSQFQDIAINFTRSEAFESRTLTLAPLPRKANQGTRCGSIPRQKRWLRNEKEKDRGAQGKIA
jgi:hypothetical protein